MPEIKISENIIYIDKIGFVPLGRAWVNKEQYWDVEVLTDGKKFLVMARYLEDLYYYRKAFDDREFLEALWMYYNSIFRSRPKLLIKIADNIKKIAEDKVYRKKIISEVKEAIKRSHKLRDLYRNFLDYLRSKYLRDFVEGEDGVYYRILKHKNIYYIVKLSIVDGGMDYEFNIEAVKIEDDDIKYGSKSIGSKTKLLSLLKNMREKLEDFVVFTWDEKEVRKMIRELLEYREKLEKAYPFTWKEIEVKLLSLI